MLPSLKLNRKKSSRQQIAIQGVRDGVLELPGMRYRLILKVSSINFELKSEEEQDAIIETYQNFINSLSSPIQFIIRVREMDIENYITDFESRIQNSPDTTNTVLNTQVIHYTSFVRKLVRTNKILSRNFYVVIPYDATEKMQPSMIREQLILSASIILKGFSKLGVQGTELTSLEVLDLFYNFYSPIQAKQQPITDQTIQVLTDSYL